MPRLQKLKSLINKVNLLALGCELQPHLPCQETSGRVMMCSQLKHSMTYNTNIPRGLAIWKSWKQLRNIE